MDELILKQLEAFNQIYKELDDLYHDYAKHCGMADSAFWVLCFICERQEPYTQKELCDTWFYSRQTINSTLKALEKQGYLSLVLAPDSRKNKQILLTPAGKEFVREKIYPMMEAERRSFAGMSDAERAGLLALFQKHVTLLGAEIEKEKSEMGGAETGLP